MTESKPKYQIGDHVHIVDPDGNGPFVIGQGTISDRGLWHRKEVVKVNGKWYDASFLRPLGTIVGEIVSTESGLIGEVLRYTPAMDSVQIKTGRSTPDGWAPYAEFPRSLIRPVNQKKTQAEPEPSLRDRLAECFRDYAKQALDSHQWEAATAYLRAADIAEAFGLTPKETER